MTAGYERIRVIDPQNHKRDVMALRRVDMLDALSKPRRSGQGPTLRPEHVRAGRIFQQQHEDAYPGLPTPNWTADRVDTSSGFGHTPWGACSLRACRWIQHLRATIAPMDYEIVCRIALGRESLSLLWRERLAPLGIAAHKRQAGPRVRTAFDALRKFCDAIDP